MTQSIANATTLNPQPAMKVEMTEYDAVTGQKIRKLTSINFGKTSLNMMSTPIVIKMNVIGVRKISNIKLCITESSETVSGSGTINSDGSVSEGNFGIEHSPILSVKTSLTSFMPGINVNGIASNNNNVSISNSSNTESEYIYLNMKSPDSVKRNHTSYKWIFDFS